jgi:hypothetical protein
MPNLFSKGIGLAPKMGIFYSAPYKRYDCALNSPQSSHRTFLILTPCINYMAIIAMQGHECNIRKCSCIANFHIIWPHDLAIMFPAQSEVHVRTMMAPIIASFGGHISTVEAIPPIAFPEHFH